jgi:hypothetical protein
MTFLELCELTYEKVNRRPMTFSSVDLGRNTTDWFVPDPEMRAVIRAVQDAFDYILNLSAHWSFLQVRGKLLTISANQPTYPRRYINVDWSGLYLKYPDQAMRYPIREMDYVNWEVSEAVSTTKGIPYYLVEAPQDKWIFSPIPIADMELWGDGQLYRPRLVLEDDSPPWDVDRHSLISDIALRILEQKIDSVDQVAQQLNVQASSQAAQQGMAGLVRDYMRGFG